MRVCDYVHNTHYYTFNKIISIHYLYILGRKTRKEKAKVRGDKEQGVDFYGRKSTGRTSLGEEKGGEVEEEERGNIMF